MRKSLYILFSILLAAPQVSAQDAEWSNAEKFRNRTAFTRIVGQNSSGIYTLRSKSRFVNRKVYVQMFRENMGQMYSKLLPGMKRSVLRNVFVYENGLEVFKSKYNRKTHAIDLIHQSYNIEAEPQGKEKVVTTSPQRDYSDEGDYVLNLSTDRTKVLCFHTEISKNKNLVIEILILDAPSMTEIGRKKVELPFKYKRHRRLDFKVANNGKCQPFGVLLEIFDASKINLNHHRVNHSPH